MRYLENTNKKSSFFHSSSKINNYYFIIFLRRPILDLKFPLMSHDYKKNHFIIASTLHRYICAGEGKLGIVFPRFPKTFKYQIQLGHSTTYYSQGNGIEESSNKILMRIIRKLLQENKKSWNTKLIHALWAH